MFDQLDQEHDSEDEGMEDYKIGGDEDIFIFQVTIQSMLEKCFYKDT